MFIKILPPRSGRSPFGKFQIDSGLWPSMRLNGLGQATPDYLSQQLYPLFFTEIPASLEDRFRMALPAEGAQYADDMIRVSHETGVSPLLLAGIMQAETKFGTSAACKGLGPACKSPTGKYLGLMQYDTSYADWSLEKLANGRPKWTVPYFNMRRGAEWMIQTKDELIRRLKNAKVNTRQMDLDLLGRAVIAAYNKGPAKARTAVVNGQEPGTVTAVEEGRNYVDRTLAVVNNIRDSMKATGTV